MHVMFVQNWEDRWRVGERGKRGLGWGHLVVKDSILDSQYKRQCNCVTLSVAYAVAVTDISCP